MGETEESIGTVREMQGPTEYWTAGSRKNRLDLALCPSVHGPSS